MCIGNRHETAGKLTNAETNVHLVKSDVVHAVMKNLFSGKGANLAKKDQPLQGAAPEYFFMLVILRCYRFFTAKQTELPAPPIDLFNKEKHQERRKGNGSSFEAA